MKKIIYFTVLIVITFMIAGCSTVNKPLFIGDGSVGPRVGHSQGRLIFGIGNVDAGVITAAREAEITRIGAVDIEIKRFLGFIVVSYKITVSGH